MPDVIGLRNRPKLEFPCCLGFNSQDGGRQCEGNILKVYLTEPPKLWIRARIPEPTIHIQNYPQHLFMLK